MFLVKPGENGEFEVPGFDFFNKYDLFEGFSMLKGELYVPMGKGGNILYYLNPAMICNPEGQKSKAKRMFAALTQKSIIKKGEIFVLFELTGPDDDAPSVIIISKNPVKKFKEKLILERFNQLVQHMRKNGKSDNPVMMIKQVRGVIDEYDLTETFYKDDNLALKKRASLGEVKYLISK